MPPPPPSTQGILEPGSAATRFVLTRTEPSPDLRDPVERHWVVRWALPEGEPFVQEILPHPCVNLAGEPGLIAVHGIPLGRCHTGWRARASSWAPSSAPAACEASWPAR